MSRQLATRFWPGVNPIGQRARRGSANGPEMTVVGVVEDAKFETLGPSSSARAYVPLRQRYRDWQTLVVHTRGDPAAAIAQLKNTVAGADPALPVYGATTMEQLKTDIAAVDVKISPELEARIDAIHVEHCNPCP